jgi:hypothetical protein
MKRATTEPTKFMNVRLPVRVIAKVKLAAATSDPPLMLNEYLREILDKAEPKKGKNGRDAKAVAHPKRTH